MANKYYAVRKGYKPGIYKSWIDCEKQIKGYSGCDYKAFSTQEEAQNYINNSNSSIPTILNKDTLQEANSNIHQIYVDGSYSESENKASYGYIVLNNDNEIYRNSGIVDNPDNVKMKNVAGELAGVMSALTWAKTNKILNVIIFYDYEGIEKWTNDEWKTKNNNTTNYKEFINNIKEMINIKFIKVKAHSDNKYNDIVDELAKEVLRKKNQINMVDSNLSDNKEFSIMMNNDDSYKLIEYIKNTYEITSKEVQNGVQYIICNNKEKFFITKYDSSRILFQGKPYKIYNDIILFLSSIEYCSNNITEMNENFYNFKSNDINLHSYLPKSYNKVPNNLISVLQPSLLEKPTHKLNDYSMYLFPALRTLEGSIKHLLSLYNIMIDKHNFNCFNGTTCQLQDKFRKIIQNKNIKLAEHIEKMYKYYKANRNPLFHTTSIPDEIKVISNYEEIKTYISEILELLDEAFYLYHLNE